MYGWMDIYLLGIAGVSEGVVGDLALNGAGTHDRYRHIVHLNL